MMLLSFFGKIHDGLSEVLAPIRRSLTQMINEDPLNASPQVPDDVLEGHFVVVAKKGEETKRFVMELNYLCNPAFLRLLERAREEFGFRQKGVLEIPCHPQELEKILEERRDQSVGDGSKLTDSIHMS
ncbi:auxin-responsive protein SAUR71-like [Vigna radiata var. radiata]|uniref:Auxin-responsive protein SAUR71-like n=1 Tax=Vigna radiata var. radiata TaxID=3916 RepID=A0A1S3V0C8_VIGRR|nr:auxin-responsive protein SAUR71-like [Vigna radiata var. radiata]